MPPVMRHLLILLWIILLNIHFAVGSIFNGLFFKYIFLHFLFVFVVGRQVAIDAIDDLITAHINFASFQLTAYRHFHPCIVSNERVTLNFFFIVWSQFQFIRFSDWCSDNIVCIHSWYTRGNGNYNHWIKSKLNDILIFSLNVEYFILIMDAYGTGEGLVLSTKLK